MKETRVTLPELVLVAGTRGALGAGLGLLLAEHLSATQRRTIGWTLFLFGALTTIPILIDIFGVHRWSPSNADDDSVAREPTREQAALAVASRSWQRSNPGNGFRGGRVPPVRSRRGATEPDLRAGRSRIIGD